MRVISGKYRGLKLDTVDSKTTRPTTDRTKEGLFNLLQNQINKKIILDLFAGSGALGIEALSRGAMKVIFNDNNYTSNKILKDNLSKLKIKNFDIYNLEYIDCLNRLRGTKYDLIFLDPPYHQKTYYSKVIDFLLENKMLNKNAYIVCESNQNITEYNDQLVIWKHRNYGKSIITIFTINN